MNKLRMWLCLYVRLEGQLVFSVAYFTFHIYSKQNIYSFKKQGETGKLKLIICEVSNENPKNRHVFLSSYPLRNTPQSGYPELEDLSWHSCFKSNVSRFLREKLINADKNTLESQTVRKTNDSENTRW